MHKPETQFAIKLADFMVTNVNFDLQEFLIASNAKKSIDTDISIDMGFSDDKPNSYTIKFIVKLANEDSKPARFYLDVTAVALFETKESITEEFKTSHFVKTNSPAIAFPFVRSFINTLTTNAGIPPIVLPPYNFTKAI